MTELLYGIHLSKSSFLKSLDYRLILLGKRLTLTALKMKRYSFDSENEEETHGDIGEDPSCSIHGGI